MCQKRQIRRKKWEISWKDGEQRVASKQGVRDNLFKPDNGDNDNIKEGNDDSDDDDDDHRHDDTVEQHKICYDMSIICVWSDQ